MDIPTKVCEECKKTLPETSFYRYKNVKYNEYRRGKRCNACRQNNPKRMDLKIRNAKSN